MCLCQTEMNRFLIKWNQWNDSKWLRYFRRKIIDDMTFLKWCQPNWYLNWIERLRLFLLWIELSLLQFRHAFLLDLILIVTATIIIIISYCFFYLQIFLFAIVISGFGIVLFVLYHIKPYELHFDLKKIRFCLLNII